MAVVTERLIALPPDKERTYAISLAVAQLCIRSISKTNYEGSVRKSALLELYSRSKMLACRTAVQRVIHLFGAGERNPSQIPAELRKAKQQPSPNVRRKLL